MAGEVILWLSPPIAFLLFQAGDSHITRFFVGATLANTIQIVIKQTNRGTAIKEITGDLSKMGGASSRAQGLLGGFGSALGGIFKVASGMVAAHVFEKLASGVVDMAMAGFDFNNSMEQATAKINAFTKDGALTAQILEDIRKEAAKTPFEFEAMADATAGLLPAAKQAGESIMDLVKDAEILAASNPAEGLEGAAFALREAVSGDFTSVIERFNLPRSMINQLKKEGLPSLEIVRRAMNEMGYDMDLVSALANTASGRWSTLKDTFTNLAGTVTKPIFDGLSGSLGDLNMWLTENLPLFEDFANMLAGQINDAITGLVTKIRELIAAFQTGGTGGLLAALGLSPGAIAALSSAVDMVSEILSNSFEEIMGAIAAVGIAIGSVVAGGVIASLVAALGAISVPLVLLTSGIALLGAAWSGNWFGMRDAHAQAWATIQPILSNMYDWLYTNIPIAVQVVSDVWANTLQPALVQAGAWINENLIPVLNDLNNWLSTNIPVAVKVLADYWTGTLLPALTPVGDWFTNVFTPALQDINTWLVTNLPVALQTAADFWINTLQPAMVSVGDYIINNILPLLESIGNLLNATINKAIEASAGLWQNVLLPAIMKVGNALLDNLQPALDFIVPLLTSLGATVNDEVRPGLQEMAEDVLPVFQKGMDAITEAIKTAIGYFNSLAEAVSSFELPPVLTPGSPPPFAYALMDIASGAKEAGAALKDMMFSTAMAGAKAKGAGNLFGDMLNFGDEGHLKSRGFSDTRARNIKAAYRSALTELWDELSAGTATAMDLEALTKQNAGGWAQFVDSADIAFQTVTERIKTAGSEMAEELRKQMTDRMMAMGQGFASFGDFIVGMLKQQQQPTQDVLANNEKLTQSITNQQTKLADLETQLKQAIIDHGAESEQVKRKREEIAKLTGEIKKNQQAMGKNQAELKKLAKTDVGANIELLQQFLASEQELFKYTLGKDLVGVNFVMMDRITAQEKLNQLLEEQRKEQEKIAALDKAKADLAFLQQQLSLVQLIKDQGLNPADVLGGITLGLNASLGDLLTVTSNVVTAMVDQINEDLQIASPSRLLYNKFKDQVGGAMAMGLGAAKPMLESAVQPFIDPLLSAGDQAMRQTNYYFSQVVNTRATDSSVISDFKTMQMMLGA